MLFRSTHTHTKLSSGPWGCRTPTLDAIKFSNDANLLWSFTQTQGHFNFFFSCHYSCPWRLRSVHQAGLAGQSVHQAGLAGQSVLGWSGWPISASGWSGWPISASGWSGWPISASGWSGWPISARLVWVGSSQCIRLVLPFWNMTHHAYQLEGYKLSCKCVSEGAGGRWQKWRVAAE